MWPPPPPPPARGPGRAPAAGGGGRPPGAPTTLAAGPRAADQLAVAGRQHWSGCDRRCGRPRGPVVEVTAAADGYHVTGPA
ncbi:hypothetical protein [Nocardia farcinica]|uniref:hypothetical protein n=1 Tax=Nocardia farcinica TaxID=37329 RepID=UPI003CC7EE7F